MLNRIFITTLLIICSNLIFGQTEPQNDSTVYKSHIIKDYRIEKLDKTYTESFLLEGYRIQIYSGNKKQLARQEKLKFMRNYKEVKAYESYPQPQWKVRVGDFKTKLEALKFQKELLQDYPNCFIVKDQIEFEKPDE